MDVAGEIIVQIPRPHGSGTTDAVGEGGGGTLVLRGSAMEMSWQRETGRLICQWSEVGERVPYNPPWMQDASRDVHRKNVSPSFLDFTKLSPFGGREWYDPGSARTRSGLS
jgi:hypothetical protein